MSLYRSLTTKSNPVYPEVITSSRAHVSSCSKGYAAAAAAAANTAGSTAASSGSDKKFHYTETAFIYPPVHWRHTSSLIVSSTGQDGAKYVFAPTFYADFFCFV